MSAETTADGIHAMAPKEAMPAHVRKLRDTYERVPGAPLFKKEFGFYCLEEWKEQGMPQDVPFAELFEYDDARQGHEDRSLASESSEGSAGQTPEA